MDSPRASNILDPIHDTLAPEVWNNPGDPEPIFKPQHAKWLVSECVRIFHEAVLDDPALNNRGSLLKLISNNG